MATWYDLSMLDALLNTVKNGNPTFVWLLDDYSQADNYATVSGNKIAEAAITGDDFDTPQPAGTNAKRLTFAGKSGVATSDSSTENLHIAIVTGSVVLVVTNETSNQSITNGNPVTFP
ncbi:MAG: hypothetical protein ACR2PH_16500, partial [Desulfobulbia bacterium]